ncbi:glycosyl hydrolase [Kitasatospora sp. NPDC057965]|uniref:glycosyl hydrolase n=1 Tax=Kitasatospora sp. NPDC057965 TaxID=3346291 RepID=UPI0036DC93BA
MTAIDLRLDGLQPADEHTAELADRIWPNHFESISRHNVGERSFIVAFDRTATWDYPNARNIVSFDVVRDSSQATYSLRSSRHATLAFAQNWLVNRGCPPDVFALTGDVIKPADEMTVRVEDRIRRSGTRLEVVDYLVMDGGDLDGWSMAVDREDEVLPVRVFLEELQPDQGTYTVREGAFADFAAAGDWLEERSTPLPEAPEYRLEAETLRTSAALSRTAAALPQSSTPVTTAATPVGPTQSPGRSL